MVQFYRCSITQIARIGMGKFCGEMMKLWVWGKIHGNGVMTGNYS